MNTNVIENAQTDNQWIRLLYMILFLFILKVMIVITFFSAIIQFIYKLINKKSEKSLLKLGSNLGEYLKQVIEFLLYKTETKPFPFSDWPDVE
ncbi:MAG: DUF4389 domain-containing protein [Calditrichales bacterium]|nr:DUF4389 domain-containing protein [Calditrichales bacterium]